ncbi:MAG: hypothetical protein DLM72_08305 [Candidatus Nitrosopolaris wilkensis]|nr:MAG: hypothetical protein DLM72_08305 [Candidatus Nitrosopolaris wilkensis]
MMAQQSVYGLDYIMRHFLPPIWPRTISTHTTEGSQVIVHSREEALARFNQAKGLDCRINAYRYREDWSIDLLPQAPDFLFTDLDLCQFSSIEALNRALNKVLRNIKTVFHDDNIQPTVQWSGNGYHIYLPIEALVLEQESVFYDLVGNQAGRKFLQFAEQFLSNKKADSCHTKGLSFKNCILRIPGSINSKNGATVRIIQEWNGVRPAINWLLRDYRRYLIQQVFVESRQGKTEQNKNWINYLRNDR